MALHRVSVRVATLEDKLPDEMPLIHKIMNSRGVALEVDKAAESLRGIGRQLARSRNDLEAALGRAGAGLER